MVRSIKRPVWAIALALVLLMAITFGVQAQRTCCDLSRGRAPDPAAYARGRTLTSGSTSDVQEDAQGHSQQQIDFRLISQVGDLYPIAADTEHLYAAGASAITVFDITTDPDAPLPVGRTEPKLDFISDAVRAGSILYVAGSHGQVWAINASQPTRPRIVGAWGEPDKHVKPRHLALLHDAYMFLGSEDGIQVLDVSDPHNIVATATYTMPSYGLALNQDLLYVVSQDVAADRPGFQLRILDVSAPNHGVQVGEVDLPTSTTGNSTADRPVQFTVDGRRGFLLTWRGFYTYDLSTPQAPQRVSFLPTGPEGIFSRNFQVDGDFIYIALGGTLIVDVSNLESPRMVGRFKGPARSYGSGILAGTRFYQHSDPPSLTIVDISKWTAPRQSGFLVFPASVSHVQRHNTYLFATEGLGTIARPYGLHILDIQNPAVPHEVGTFYIQPSFPQRSIQSFVLYNKYVLLAAEHIFIVDVSKPAQPKEVFRLPVENSILGLAVEDGRLYAYTDAGLRIYDLSNPADPQLTATARIPVSFALVQAFRIIRGYLYVLSSDGFRVFDITTPQRPVLTFYQPENWQIHDIELHADVNDLYVTAYKPSVGDAHLYVFDVSLPMLPKEITYIPWTTWPSGLYAMGSLVFTGTSAKGAALLGVYDISEPLSPTLILTSALTSGGLIVPLSGAGDLLFLGGSASDLQLREIQAQASDVFSDPGGDLHSLIDRTQYSFPPHAFPAQTQVTVTHTSLFSNPPHGTGALRDIGHAFEVIAVDRQTGREVRPAAPYTLTVRYSDRERGSVAEESLALYRWNGAVWTREPSSTLDAAANTITATPRELGLWAILGRTHQMVLPIVALPGP